MNPRVVAHLNSTPREVLGYQTSLEVFTAPITENVLINS
jgi:IS30 family transposase